MALPYPSARAIKYAFAAAALLVSGVGVVAYRSIDALVGAAEWETHSQEVLAEVQRAGRLAGEAQSARRGYALSGDEAQAELCREAAAGLVAGIAHMRLLTRDNPRQQRRLAELEPLVQAYVGRLLKTIAEQRPGSATPESRAADVAMGASLKLPIQGLLEEMNAEEQTLLETRHFEAEAGARTSGRVIVASSLFAVLTLLGATLTLLRTGARRMAAEADLVRERELLESVVGRMGDGLIVTDERGAFVIFNPAAERLLGVRNMATSPEHWASDFQIFLPDTVTPFPAEDLPLARALRGEAVDGVELYVARPGGGGFIIVGARPLRSSSGALTGAVAVFSDSSERRRAAAEVEAVNLQLLSTVADLERLTAEKTILAELGDLLHSCLTLDEAYDAVRGTAARLFAGCPGALFAVNPSHNHLEQVAAWGPEPRPDPVRFFEATDCWAVRRGSIHVSTGHETGSLCPHILHGGGRGHACLPFLGQEGTIAVLHVELPDAGQAAGVLRSAASLTQVVAPALVGMRLRDKLRSQSIRDPLTGLFNRRYMEESLERELRRAERSTRPIGVIMMDADHFKGFNDKHGHAAGDAVLRELGALLTSQVRGADIACRYGGEEFTLILPEAGLEDTRKRAEALRRGAAGLQLRLPDGQAASITVSQGVAAYPEHGTSAALLLASADEALYRAKRAGRDRVELAVELAEKAGGSKTTSR